MKLSSILTLSQAAVFYCTALYASAGLAGTVTVNAGTNQSDSGRDDIDQIRNYCRASGRPEANTGIGGTSSSMARIDARSLRGVNVDNSSSGNVVQNGKFVAGSPLESVLDDAKLNEYSPKIIVGQETPTGYPPDGWNWSSTTWNQYRDYAYRFVRYVALEHNGDGFSDVLFEVLLEPDINPVVWTQSSPGYNGSTERFKHLQKVYEIWQSAVNQVANEAPGRRILVGGPTITSFGVYYAGFNWQDKFIDWVADNKLRLDVYTFHSYGDFEAVGNAPPHPDFGYLRDHLKNIRDKLNSRGLWNTKISNSEAGLSSVADNQTLGRINYTHEGGAWLVAMVRDVVGRDLSDFVQLLMRDDQGASTTGTKILPSFIHTSAGQQYPKPVYNACKIFSLLPGTRKSVTPSDAGQADLVAIASGNRNSAGIVVANYNYAFIYANGGPVDRSTPQSVTIRFNSLPFSGRAVVQRYLIDANTSNVAKYLDSGTPLDLNGIKLQQVSSTNVTVSNGSVTLSPETLGQSAVSLWVIQSLEPLADGTYKIIARHSLKALDVSASSQSNGAKVQQWTYGGGANQQWSLASVGNGYYKVISNHTGSTADPKGLEAQGGSAAYGTRVVQTSYSGKPSQLWQITPVGSGFYKLLPKNAIDTGMNSGLDIDVSNKIDGLNGAGAILWGNAPNENQQFRLDNP
jgi:xylan 1,4-beta-xylosidase